MNDGTYANKTGRVLEDLVESTFGSHGFDVLPYSKFVKNPEKFGYDLVLKNAPYTNIYGMKGRSEFLVKSKTYDLDLRIECKWQQVSGSVDEKFPYLYMNVIEQIEEPFVIIICDGLGARAGSIQWLRDAVSEFKFRDGNPDYKEKRIEVFNMTEFVKWANQALR
jgi:hypothetical protein